MTGGEVMAGGGPLARGGRRTPSAESTSSGNAWITATAIVMLLCLAIGSAWAYWAPRSTPGGNGASAATSVAQGATPTAVAIGGSAVTVSWAARTLTGGQAVSGYLVKRYDGANVAQTLLSACLGVVTQLTCVESSVPSGVWTYTVTPVYATNWRGAESAKSTSVTTEAVPPTNAVTVVNPVGGVARSVNTVYYRGVAGGSFQLVNAVSDAGSGPASSQSSAITGTTSGWAHTPSTVSTPAGGPFVSAPFTWSAGATGSIGEILTGRDAAGNTATTSLTFVDDSTPPTAGSISYSNSSPPIVFAAGTDALSGIVKRELQRAASSFDGSVCGDFGTYTPIGGVNPVSPYSDNTIGGSACYSYRYVVTDAVGNQDIATTQFVRALRYSTTVADRAVQGDYYRLGESLITSDTFTGTAGLPVTVRNGMTGATWTSAAPTPNNLTAVLTAAGRLRKSGTGTGQANFVSSGVPASADYTVEADVYFASTLTNDVAGIIGRVNTANPNGTYYFARYDRSVGAWMLSRVVNGTSTLLGQTAQALADGTTHQLSLDMSGSTIRLFVNGAQLVSVVDGAPITAAGRGGVAFGTANAAASTTVTDVGLHLDNVRVLPAVADSTTVKNPGVALGGVTFGAAGALGGETDTAMTFDGNNDFVQVPRLVSDDFSIEFWFKSTQGIGTGLNWWEGAALVDADVQTAGLTDFGVSLRSDGKVVGGIGNPDVSVVSATGGFADGNWHHVVFTRTRTSGLIQLYVDGATQGSATGNVAAATGSPIITFGRQASGGKFFAGSLDEIAIYTSVLTPTQVSGDFSLGFSPDTAGPTGGSVSVGNLVGTGGSYSTSTSLNITLAAGTDPSGLAASGRQLLRSTAPLTSTGGANGVCGTFGAYQLVAGGTDPASPMTDVVADQACYLYRYVVADSLGNATTYTSGLVKVDTTAPPAPAIAFTPTSNTYWSAAAPSVVYFRGNAIAGAFTTVATSIDAVSGIASYTSPFLGAGWTSTPGAAGVTTHSWAGSNTAASTGGATAATNNAGLPSGSTAFTVTNDSTAPTGGTIGYADGTTTGTTASITFTTGTDTGSGIGSRLLQRRSAPLTGGVCGTFGAFATIANGTNPAASPVVNTFAAGSCYQYQYLVTDNVGNTTTASSASVVRAVGAYAAAVTGTTGIKSYYRLGETAPATTAVDSVGTNPGTYVNGPTRGVAGALSSGAAGATAVQFDGVSQYVSVAQQIPDDFSIEFWFKSTQGIGTGLNWWEGAALVDADVQTAGLTDFGVSLRSDGRVVGGIGGGANPDVSVVSANAGFTDGNWHHVVFTRTKTSGLIQLYVDGAAQGSAVGSVATATGSPIITFGAQASGGKYFAGTLDEVSLYTTPLSQQTISAHYTAR